MIMLVTKHIILEFADSRIHASDRLHDIREAAEYAGLNLFGRFEVRLGYPKLTEKGDVMVEVGIPDTIAENFSVGNHLRGISRYLLRRYGDRYREYLVGKRLLLYFDADARIPNVSGFDGTDRLEMIRAFANLLKCSDEESLGYIREIRAVLTNARQMNG